MLLTCLLPFLATKGSRVLEAKVNETEVTKTVFSHLNIVFHVGDNVLLEEDRLRAKLTDFGSAAVSSQVSYMVENTILKT